MNKKILILGANGLLGNTLLLYFLKKNYHVMGVVKNKNKFILNSKYYYCSGNIISKENLNLKKINFIIKEFKPEFVINSIGLTKIKNFKKKIFFKINGELVKKLSSMAQKYKFKLIHFSTDCVYDGSIGNYTEKHKVNAKDNYGLSKIKGEVKSKNTITFRTSMIGHSNIKNNGLLEWFLNQKKSINGFVKMFFSGPTALELAKIIENFTIKKPIINNGLYNLGCHRISKYSLLKKIANAYKKNIVIKKNIKVNLDRSLNIGKFIKKTNYKIPSWNNLIQEQRIFYEKNKKKFI